MTSAFSSAGDRSSRFPGGDMPLQNLKSLYAESSDLPSFTQSVSPMPPYSCRQQNRRCPAFRPYYEERDSPCRLDTQKTAAGSLCPSYGARSSSAATDES